MKRDLLPAMVKLKVWKKRPQCASSGDGGFQSFGVLYVKSKVSHITSITSKSPFQGESL